MWIKDLTKNSKILLRESNRKRIIGSVTAAIIISLGATFTKGGIGYALSGTYFKSPNEILPQMLFAVMTGIIIGIIFYYVLLKKPEKSTFICPQCGKVKEDDGILPCECGGHFENIKTMKWVEDKRDAL